VGGIHALRLTMCLCKEWDCPRFSLEIRVGLESPAQMWTVFQRFLSLSVLVLGENRVVNNLEKVNN